MPIAHVEVINNGATVLGHGVLGTCRAGVEQAVGQGGRMPPRLRCNGASIGLCPHTFEWLHSLCSTWGEGRQ